jgi:hypothetical protein
MINVVIYEVAYVIISGDSQIYYTPGFGFFREMQKSNQNVFVFLMGCSVPFRQILRDNCMYTVDRQFMYSIFICSTYPVYMQYTYSIGELGSSPERELEKRLTHLRKASGAQIINHDTGSY